MSLERNITGLVMEQQQAVAVCSGDKDNDCMEENTKSAPSNHDAAEISSNQNDKIITTNCNSAAEPVDKEKCDTDTLEKHDNITLIKDNKVGVGITSADENIRKNEESVVSGQEQCEASSDFVSTIIEMTGDVSLPSSTSEMDILECCLDVISEEIIGGSNVDESNQESSIIPLNITTAGEAETSEPSSSNPDHGYCRISSNETNKTKLSTTIEDEPVRKKIKPDSSAKLPSTSMNYDNQKPRMDPCPQLSQEHIDLLLTYLANPKQCITEQLFLMQVKLSKFPRIKRYSVARQLERWGKLLMKRKIDDEVKLCLRVSEKIILPQEKYSAIIRDAHENTGVFLKEEETFKRDRSRKADHNSFHKTYTLIESEYGVGGREFGMSKYGIYEHVANCPDCTAHQKRLPSLSKVLGSIDVPKSRTLPLTNSGIMENFSSGNSNEDISNEIVGVDPDAPISMLWEKPSPGSIWHNQQGLATEANPYSKLLGVIQEVGLDLIASIQGDLTSKSKFLTKLYCATRLIQEMKSSCERNEMTADSTFFMKDYLKLQEKYIELGKLDLFLYDVNLLAIKYNLTKSEQFMQLVNTCVSKFNKMNKPSPEQSSLDMPIDIPKHLLDKR